MLEWSKKGWSYHAKGAWITLPGVQQQTTSSMPQPPPPQLSVIGSPNFGARSVQRDCETALVMLTKANSPLAHAWQAERARLLQDCKLVTLDGTTSDPSFPPERVVAAVRPPTWIRALSKLARPYM